ncbi:winged helix-turn-helix transcriptional regulator [Enterococcus sp. 669A]|uniref:Winged helix-turn-helix transcriptional regulator n=1 Tax=Candidatus Enterococcus moelleringii TaxID=2815325 RepID=A0ABS3L636_9ENTE|nr:winged helix-turn-helix domain-containing protein [Enterococcus sp. 669A]MBO1305082.1 winged helix-turn-helix transcriptional regulator [Enterococcus sp. 669A]
MFWRSITEKQTSLYLGIIALLKKRAYSLEELASEVGINEKTMRRHLKKLGKKYQLDIEVKKQLAVWKNPKEYRICYQQILQDSDQFTVFCKALWQEPFGNNFYIVKQLNRSLVPFNLCLHTREQLITGSTALLVLLQVRYIQEFMEGYTKEKFMNYWQQLKLPPDIQIEAEKWLEIIPDRSALTEFIIKWQLPPRLGCIVYFEYHMIDKDRRRLFYEKHKKQTTEFYITAGRITAILMDSLKLEPQSAEVLRERFFYLFLDLWLGVPAAYFGNKRSHVRNFEELLLACRRIKVEIPSLCNCPVEELASALYSVLKRVYPFSVAKPTFSLGLKIDGSYEEVNQLCYQLNQTIKLSHPVAFFPAMDENQTNFDLMIVEGTPPIVEPEKRTIYIEDFAFEDLIDLAAYYFIS